MLYILKHLYGALDDDKRSMMDDSQVKDLIQSTINWIEEQHESSNDSARERGYGEHYGPYGRACIRTGQFDAGLCWKCQIKKLDNQLTELKGESNG